MKEQRRTGDERNKKNLNNTFLFLFSIYLFRSSVSAPQEAAAEVGAETAARRPTNAQQPRPRTPKQQFGGGGRRRPRPRPRPGREREREEVGDDADDAEEERGGGDGNDLVMMREKKT